MSRRMGCTGVGLNPLKLVLSFAFLCCVAPLLAGCGGHTTIPSAKVGSENHPILRTQTVFVNGSDSETGCILQPYDYMCWMMPNSTISFPNMTAQPFGGYPSWTCSATTWSMGFRNGGSAVRGLTPSVSPSSTGTDGSSCARTDTVNVTFTADATLPTGFAAFFTEYGANGQSWICDPGCTAASGGLLTGESVGLWKIWSGPMPVLRIRDINKAGLDVTNTSQSSVAGQNMSFQAFSSDGSALTNCQWTIGGTPVKNFAVSNTQGVITPLASTDLQNTSVSFYWTKAADSSVQVTCEIYGASGQPTEDASTQYTSEAPTSSVSASYGTIGADANYNQDYPACAPQTTLYLHYGNPCNTPSIAWTYTATADADEQGTIALFQLVDYNASGTYVDGSTFSSMSTYQSSEATCSDNVVPYSAPVSLPASSPATWSGLDAPAMNLTSFISAHEVNHFDDYFMYMPKNDTSGSSIWVTLQRLQWSWDAQTSYANGAWAAPIVNSQGSPATGSLDSTLPEWNCMYQNS